MKTRMTIVVLLGVLMSGAAVSDAPAADPPALKFTGGYTIVEGRRVTIIGLKEGTEAASSRPTLPAAKALADQLSCTVDFFEVAGRADPPRVRRCGHAVPNPQEQPETPLTVATSLVK